MSPSRNDPDRRCLPKHEWPDVDQAAWRALFREAGPLDNPGPFAHLRKASENKYAKAYGRWIGFVGLNAPELLGLNPTNRINPERVQDFFEKLSGQGLAPFTIWAYIDGLATVITSMDPMEDWSWLKSFSGRLRRNAKPTRNVTNRLRPVSDLFAMGLHLMNEAETRKPRLKFDQSSWYRDGLMLALLAARPIRLKNFYDLHIGQQIVPQPDHYELWLKRDEVKASSPFEVRLPAVLKQYIDRYLIKHRPALLQGSQHSALWISNRGVPMTYGSVAMRIRKVTERAFGVVINVHAFRHAAATSIALEDPKHVKIIATILQHSSLITGERYYNLADSTDAGNKHQKQIHNLRKQLF